MASLVKDYENYRKFQNVTFIGICTSRTGTVKTMARQVEQFKLKPFANMLDAGGATATAYNVPKNAPFWLTVIDGDGKIAYNASRGWYWSSGPNAGKKIHQTQIEKSLKQFPEGILGGVEVPAEMRKAAHYYDLQQFALLEVELRKAESRKGSPEAKKFAEHVRARIAESRIARKAQIEELSKADPVQAYREAIAFVGAFPKAPERSDVNKLGKNLLKDAKVKREIRAEAAYQKMLVPEMKKTTTLKRYEQKVKPLLAAYMKAFGDTEYGAAVKKACEAHRDAVFNK